ncbi:MAG TPA: hypothetical protein VEL47_05490 [Myxococcota bacterium]|nr:hypothetical protein [Myxococcota bacterium]
MNINVVNRSWRALSDQFNRLIAARTDQKAGDLGQRTWKREVEKYSSWPNAGGAGMGFLASGLEVRKVDVQALEQFVENLFPNNLSYQLLMSSQLQPYARESAKDIKKVLALRNLGDLVKSTITEMKSIEHQYIARSKG